MDPDRWERLNALFYQALERDTADLDAFLIGILYPRWYVRGWMPASWGLAAFVAAVAVAGVSANLRVHLWFTSYVYRAELAEQRRPSPAVRAPSGDRS